MCDYVSVEGITRGLQRPLQPPLGPRWQCQALEMRGTEQGAVTLGPAGQPCSTGHMLDAWGVPGRLRGLRHWVPLSCLLAHDAAP